MVTGHDYLMKILVLWFSPRSTIVILLIERLDVISFISLKYSPALVKITNDIETEQRDSIQVYRKTRCKLYHKESSTSVIGWGTKLFFYSKFFILMERLVFETNIDRILMIFLNITLIGNRIHIST